jgi:hypothetical protein
MSDVFTTPDDGGDLKSSDFSTSMTDRLGAQWADTLDPKDSLSGMWALRRSREAQAGGDLDTVGATGDLDVFSSEPLQKRQDVFDAQRNSIPDISQSDAKDLLKQEGLTEQDVHLGDAPSHKLPVLKMQIEEAHTRRDRAAAIARGPQGFFPDALGAVTSIGVGMIDPVNAAAFSIPVLGEARMGKILMSAGDSILARGAVRFGEGAAQGAIGTAALQPADWWLHTRDGQDYTMANAMESIIMGAGMGGAFHSLHGGLTDYLARRQGLPLPGSPQDLLVRGLMTGTHVPARALADDGVPLEEVPGIGPVDAQPNETAPIDVPHPAEVLSDLPTPVRQDVVHAAMADVIAGRPTNAAEMLGIAADHDPRIAESFDAWHGSPHDFDRFDADKFGTGEGAQAYGHGLYFAENEKVARSYQRATSDKAFVNKVAELYDEGHSPDDAWAEIMDNWKDFTPAEQRLMTALEKDDWLGFDYPHQAVSAALRDIKAFDVSPETAAAARAVGNMYRVKIAANHEHFLDWDKSIEEQSGHMRDALLNHPDPMIAGTFAKHGHDVGQAYTRIAVHLGNRSGQSFDSAIRGEGYAERQGMASKALADAGIPGIKYLDQGSRDRGAGTRNFVVFDDKHIEITHKNGEPVTREELKAEHDARRVAIAANDNPPVLSDPATVAADPRWRELAETTPDFNEPETLAESEAAALVPEPDSVQPTKSLSALDKAAADAEEVWRQLEPTLTEEERASVNSALDQLRLDAEARSKIITDGVTCLAGAIG